jgi:hypothetical protein
VSQESGDIDYDAKNLMHTFRLLMSAENIFENGEPLVRFCGTRLKLLMDVRAGKFAYEQLLDMGAARIETLQNLHAKSTLPDQPDHEFVEDLLLSITRQWEDQYA